MACNFINITSTLIANKYALLWTQLINNCYIVNKNVQAIHKLHSFLEFNAT